MLPLYLGLYTITLALVWGLFIVVKIHAFKFKNFSTNIQKLMNVLFITLIILSVLGYVAIFMSGAGNSEVKVTDYGSFDTKEVNY